MAHECHDCYMQCYCNGDIDDLLLNADEDIDSCIHCLYADKDDDEGEFDVL